MQVLLQMRNGKLGHPQWEEREVRLWIDNRTGDLRKHRQTCHLSHRGTHNQNNGEKGCVQASELSSPSCSKSMADHSLSTLER